MFFKVKCGIAVRVCLYLVQLTWFFECEEQNRIVIVEAGGGWLTIKTL